MIVQRAVLVAVTVLVAVFYYAPAGRVDFVENWGMGTFGARIAARGPEIEAVSAGSAAARAGVRPGDRLVVSDERERSQFASPYAGTSGLYTFERDGRLASADLVATPVPGFGFWQRAGGILALIPPTIFLAVAFALTFLRPSVMTWAFYVFAIGYFGTSPVFGYWSHVLPLAAFRALSFVLVTVCGSWSVMALLPFVLRFPNADVAGWRKKADALVWLALAATFAAYVAEWIYARSHDGAIPWWSVYSDQLVPLLAFAFATLIVAKNYAVATPAERKRYGFLVLGTIAAFVAYAVYFIPGVPFEVGQIVGFAVVLMPISVAYAAFRLRVIDVSFVLNRALVYGALSVAVIAIVSLLDWAVSHVVAEERLALGFELLVTVCIGFLLDRINRFIERFVEAIFFRKRRMAEQYLHRVAAALPYATEESAVSDGLTQAPVDALGLSAAALYRLSDDEQRFDGVATSAETTVAPPGFSSNHLLVRMMNADEKPVWLDDVRTYLDRDNSAIYVLAVPVTVRHKLVSFTLYGAHVNGAQIDPEEVQLLDELSREASRAYDHIEAVRARERYAKTALPV